MPKTGSKVNIHNYDPKIMSVAITKCRDVEMGATRTLRLSMTFQKLLLFERLVLILINEQVFNVKLHKESQCFHTK